MGRKKLLKQLIDILGLSSAEKSDKLKEVKDLLSSLEDKESNLQAKLQQTQDESDIITIKQKIETIQTYRNKGIEMLNDLENEP